LSYCQPLCVMFKKMPKRQTCLIIVLTAITLLTFGQTSKIKKVTEINYEYGTTFDLTTDTIIKEYNIKGIQIFPPANSNTTTVKIKFPIKTETVDSTQSIIHRRQLWSDSTVKDIFQFNNTYSIVTFLIDKQDTISKTVQKIRQKRIIEESTTFYDKSNPRTESLTVDKNTFLTKKTTFTTIDNHEFNNTIKVSYNKIFRVRKEHSYNFDKNEWFVVKKEKFNTKGQSKETVEQFYNESQKEYFTTKTKSHFNNQGQKDSETVYDCNLKAVEKRRYFEYF
jgi:hypothetical protein